jgi:hypothetical protein
MGNPVNGITGSGGIVVDVVVDAPVVVDGSDEVDVLLLLVVAIAAVVVVVVASPAVVSGAESPPFPHAATASTATTSAAVGLLDFTVVLLRSGREHFQFIGSRERAVPAVGQFEPCVARRQQDRCP